MTQLSDSERLAWLRLSRTDGIGPQTFHKLISRYKTASRALEALPTLVSKGGGKRGLTVYGEELAIKELQATADAGAQLVCAANPPTLIFYATLIQRRRCCASRAISSYCKKPVWALWVLAPLPRRGARWRVCWPIVLQKQVFLSPRG